MQTDWDLIQSIFFQVTFSPLNVSNIIDMFGRKEGLTWNHPLRFWPGSPYFLKKIPTALQSDDNLFQRAKLLHIKEEYQMEIRVLGPGCPNCKATKQNVKEAMSEIGVDASVDEVTEFMEIAKHGVFETPAVVIDGEVKSVGKVPQEYEIKSWIRE